MDTQNYDETGVSLEELTKTLEMIISSMFPLNQPA